MKRIFVFKTQLEKWKAFHHLYCRAPGRNILPQERLQLALGTYYNATEDSSNDFIEKITAPDMSYWGIRVRIEQIIEKLEQEEKDITASEVS